MSENATPHRQPDPARGRVGVADLLQEPGLFLGSGSAVMLQLAVWGVGKGVAEHSNTLDRPLDRLRTTLSYVYVMGLGTDEERRQVARMVNRAHAPIKGEGYTAFDPELQLWVAATLAEVGKQMYENIFGPLDPDSLERCYQEGWVYGTALQVKPEMWPPTRADFEIYWEQMEQTFSSDPQIRHYARSLLSFRKAKWYVKPGSPFISLMTRGNLSPRAREVLALPWSERDQRRYERVWRVVRRVYPLVPRFVRRLPARVAMADIRRRLEAGKRLI
ncbi:MAG: DUF2236 domain-containing protein [Myxococcales bacterium]|nr:MAG: DUF2236 domain-containing protein [Myxococcales bacterium]